ncbi:MAG: stage sporulation protein (SpoIIE), partial [Verrucomicrobia bacterium]|nr:stage sporulation protein (SpoIIE) [Verrucomicrobiota bacterium]
MSAEAHNTFSQVEWAAVSRPLPGQTATGDASLVKSLQEGILFAVVDGLGHGLEAAKAAETGLNVLSAQADSPLISLVNLCHEALRQTRGAVMSLAAIDYHSERMTWLGVGNVDATLLRANPQNQPATQSVLQRSGMLGLQLPALQTDVLPLGRGDLLIFNTDGIRPDFIQTIVRSDPCSRIAQRILDNFFKETDDALVLVARYHGRAA